MKVEGVQSSQAVEMALIFVGIAFLVGFGQAIQLPFVNFIGAFKEFHGVHSIVFHIPTAKNDRSKIGPC